MAVTVHQGLALVTVADDAAWPEILRAGGLAKHVIHEITSAVAAVLEEANSLRAACAGLAPAQQLLLGLFRELGGRCTVQQLKAAAARAGLSSVDADLRELMQNALVLYAGPGINMHEL